MSERIKVYAIIRENNPSLGMTKIDFGYVTLVPREKADGTKYQREWMAEIEEEVIENPDSFVMEVDPCGSALSASEIEDINNYDHPLKEIGYIEDGKLVITGSIEVEEAWRSTPEGLVATRTRKVGKKN